MGTQTKAGEAERRWVREQGLERWKGLEGPLLTGRVGATFMSDVGRAS